MTINLSKLLEHQGIIQGKLQNEVTSKINIAYGWAPVHYAVSMLDAVIEETIEAKRLIKARKWWTSAAQIVHSNNSVYGYTKTRKELLSELCDILIQFVNALHYLGVTEDELETALNEKLGLNDPDHPNSTIGNRS